MTIASDRNSSGCDEEIAAHYLEVARELSGSLPDGWTGRIREIIADVRREPGLMSPRKLHRTVAARLLAELAESGVYSDSARVSGVWPHAGSLVLNPFRGCNFGCVYCFRPREDAGPADWFLKGSPVRVHDEAKLVEQALRHPYFVPGKTIIGLHTATTDPLLPSTRPSTYRMLELLKASGTKNPVMIITKMPVTATDLEWFGKAAPIVVLLLLTFNSAPPEMETFSGIRDLTRRRWATLDLLSDAASNIRVAHYYRPIVPDWNDSDEQIIDALKFGERLGITVIGGLKPIAGLAKYVAGRGLSGRPVESMGTTGKYFPEELERRILDHHTRLGLKSIVVKDQSCALTLMLRQRKPEPNVEALRLYDSLLARVPQCMARCPRDQIDACSAGGLAGRLQVRDLLNQIGRSDIDFDLFHDRIEIEPKSISRAEIEVLVGATRKPVLEKRRESG